MRRPVKRDPITKEMRAARETFQAVSLQFVRVWKSSLAFILMDSSSGDQLVHPTREARFVCPAQISQAAVLPFVNHRMLKEIGNPTRIMCTSSPWTKPAYW